LPGVGFPHWKVELLRIRNGIPGVWCVHWSGGRFVISQDNMKAVKPVGNAFTTQVAATTETTASAIRLKKAM
jgi:hypothetical protein